MRKFLQCFLLILLPSLAYGQAKPTCGTMEYLAELEKQQPGLKTKMNELEGQTTAWLKEHRTSLSASTGTVITIPVVVHVVYSTEEANISDEQIQSQIEVLNEDFRRLNADALNTPTPFKAFAADAEIQFQLAKRNPNGIPTNGITRTYTPVETFNPADNGVKFTDKGGVDAWPRDKYLNIWVCTLPSGENGALLGYAQFPGIGAAATDGVVIGWKYFGRIGTAKAPFHRGRTTTHEVGHWLNLRHIWGDADCGDDFVSDTPTQATANNGCRTFPYITCDNTPNGDMFMNYMDYTGDECMNMFTNGQENRMKATLYTSRAGLLTSDALTPVVIANAFDAGIAGIKPGKDIYCNQGFAPIVTLKNWGSNVLQTVDIHYQVDGGSMQTMKWTGSLSPLHTTEVTLPSQVISIGAHNIKVYTSSPNAEEDEDASNDSFTTSFQQQTLPFSEGFETNTFPPVGWLLKNPDRNKTWERTGKAAVSGTASAYINNEAYEDGNGQVDELLLPAIDLSTVEKPEMAFKLAYSLFTDPATEAFSDTLEVLISTDCGESFTQLYKRAGSDLTTVTPIFRDIEFIPTAADWRQEVIDLSAYKQEQNVLIKFRHTTDYENNLFVDEVAVREHMLTSSAESLAGQVSVVPNPSTGVVRIISPSIKLEKLRVLDLLGHVVEEREILGEEHTVSIDLSMHKSGLYILQFTTVQDKTFRKKILLTK